MSSALQRPPELCTNASGALMHTGPQRAQMEARALARANAALREQVAAPWWRKALRMLKGLLIGRREASHGHRLADRITRDTAKQRQRARLRK